VIEIIVSIGIIFGILLILYWRIMWRLRVDERGEFLVCGVYAREDGVE
jgi:hypothetical protein